MCIYPTSWTAAEKAAYMDRRRDKVGFIVAWCRLEHLQRGSIKDSTFRKAAEFWDAIK